MKLYKPDRDKIIKDLKDIGLSNKYFKKLAELCGYTISSDSPKNREYYIIIPQE